MDYRRIKYWVENSIAHLVFNDPGRLNPMDVPMLDDILSALEACALDEGVKVLVMSGEGGSFSAGGDIRSMIDEFDTLPALARKLGEAALKIRNLKKPVIASLKGAVAGAAFNLALLCDFRIAADNCRFLQAFIKIGLIPDTGGVFLLTRMIGMARATELAMTGRTIDSQEAMSLGLLTRVVPLADLESETMRFAEQIAASPGLALWKIKQLVNRSALMGFENHLENELEYQVSLFSTEDFKEGITAFAEKRRPNFRSR
ncbi:MAG: enoyl-CoA hydratase [Firmicutes bacterium]|nr:enoyl-CoA hydratase [Bacillota bacterium]